MSDLSLPRTAPSVARYHDQNHHGLHLALYTLVDLSDHELDELQQTCEQENIACDADPGSIVRIAQPRARFVGQPLRAVFDAHLALPEPLAFDPVYFIVAVDRDWETKGVLLVALDDDDLRCRVDYVRMAAKDTGLVFVNLQLGNEGWSDVKESYSLDDDDEGHDDSGDDGGDSDDSGPEPPKKPSKDNLKYGIPYIGIYVVEGVDTEKLLREIEPSYDLKKPENYMCRIQAVLSPTSNPVDQAFALHPVRCRKSPWMHKRMFFVVDNASPEERHMVLARLDWDGDTKNRTKEELRALGSDPSIARKTRLLPKTATEGVQYGFLKIMRDHTVFDRGDEPAFLLFPGSKAKKAWKLFERGPWRLKPGQERFIMPPLRTPLGRGLGPLLGGQESTHTLDETVERFPLACMLAKHESNLSFRYFVYAEGPDEEKEGLDLVRVDWDEKVRRSPQELLALHPPFETLRVPFEEVYGTLRAGVRQELSDFSEGYARFFRD